MLDESEYEQVRAAYESCLRSVKNYREQHEAPLKDTPLAELWRPVQQVYARLTGVVGLDPEHTSSSIGSVRSGRLASNVASRCGHLKRGSVRPAVIRELPNKRLKLTARVDYGMNPSSARRSLSAIR